MQYFYIFAFLALIIFIVYDQKRGRKKDQPTSMHTRVRQEPAIDGKSRQTASHTQNNRAPAEAFKAWNKNFHSNATPCNARIRFEYESDDIEEREVKISKFTNTHISGFCFLREAPRIFRIDKVIDPIDTKTGEVINEPLNTFLYREYTKRPEEAQNSLLGELTPIANLFIAVSRSDGVMVKQEREAIGKWIIDHAGIAPERANRIIDRMRGAFYNNKISIVDECQAIIKTTPEEELPNKLQSIYSHAEHIATADKKIKPEELAILQTIYNEFSAKVSITKTIE